MMKAALTTAYGGPEVIRLAQVPRPVPNSGEILVRVHAAAVTAADVRLRSAVVPRGFGPMVRAMIGFHRPRRPVMGMFFAGTVEALGAGVTEYPSGTPVFGSTEMKGGAHAQYLVIRADGAVLLIPEGLSMAEAAGFSFGGLTAMDFLIDKGALVSGERLLINGATGSVGTAAIQIARYLGAHVTAVCSARTADLARDMGCDAVIDYHGGTIAGSYDMILDVVGTLPYARSRSLLAEGGRLLPVTATLAAALGAALRPRRGSHRVTSSFTAADRVARSRLIDLYRARAYRPVLGPILPFDQVTEAHRLASAGGNRGTIVVMMVPDEMSAPSSMVNDAA
jgi:NADPH:quinone reductase-like Zn-dependent oxidoreductase